MSNVYSLEPPTTGKVILVTNYGNIDIELWTKEAPRACRNFLQLCLEGYYNHCIFFRIIKGFMIQTGDPMNKGAGGESIWGKEFNDEFHSRLKFNHRGIVAMANKNVANTNSSQFFITMDKCEWLNRKHTIFGKVVGDTLFNALSISEIPTKNESPLTETLPMIIRVEVLINPFTDLVPRKLVKEKISEVNDSVMKKSLYKFIQTEKLKNTNLLSFQDDECESTTFFNKNFIIRPIHEIVKNDRKLINVPVIDKKGLNPNKVQNLKEKIKQLNTKEESSYSESSESEDLEDITINQLQKEDLNIDLDRKSEIIQLKEDIVKIKRRLDNPYEEKDTDNDSKPMTALQKHQSQYLGLKKGRTNTKEAFDKLNKFKEKIKTNRAECDNWMSNKLKFHVDSQKAYAISESKEKQMKRINYDPSI